MAHTFGFEDEESPRILGLIFQIGRREGHGMHTESIVARGTTAHLHGQCPLQILLRILLPPRRHHSCRLLCFPGFLPTTSPPCSQISHVISVHPSPWLQPRMTTNSLQQAGLHPRLHFHQPQSSTVNLPFAKTPCRSLNWHTQISLVRSRATHVASCACKPVGIIQWRQQLWLLILAPGWSGVRGRSVSRRF